MDDATTSPSRTRCGSATTPGHGAAHRSGNVFLATAWRIPSLSFSSELVRERWGARIIEGCHRPSRLGLPRGSTVRSHRSESPVGVPSLWSPNNPNLLGSSLGILPHLPVAEQEGSRCAAAARKHLWWGLIPCSPFPPSASSSLSSRLTSFPVLPGKARVVLNLQLLYSIK